MAADRFNINRTWEHVQSKHVGTGHSDSTKFEWATNHHRDSIASYIGHSDLLSYFAAAENKSIGRVRYELMERMLQPCGPPLPKEEDEEDDDEGLEIEVKPAVAAAAGAPAAPSEKMR